MRHDDDPSPAKHAPDCNGIGHKVSIYPVRMALSDLTWDKKLPPYYASRGWTLRADGGRFYRVKMLCRDCMGLEQSAEERKREYLEACKATRGQSNQSYAQMLASQ